MTVNALSIDNIHVTYRGSAHPVLRGFSLTIAPGQVACLLGASGCGKTTVLRAIAGFERLQQGCIAIAGQPVASEHLHLSTEQRQTGMVFQDYALFPHLTVAQNIAFGLRRLAKDTRAERVAELLELIELPAYGEYYPQQLSGGQQQRVALGRALAPRPKLLLLDEPFSSLDSGTRERISREVREILLIAGQTALMVTHSEMEAQAMAGTLGRVVEGRYQAVND